MRQRHDPLYIAFLHYFNQERDYFECHEVMEELWLSEGRSPLWQGLLQIAVGLHHHANNNVNGAVKLLSAAIDKLKPRTGAPIGIDLEELLRHAETRLRQLMEEGERAPFGPIDIMITDPELAEAVRRFAAARPPDGEGVTGTPPETF
jgi:hypothetical protein